MAKISLKSGGYSVSGKSAKFGVSKGQDNYVSRNAPKAPAPAPTAPKNGNTPPTTTPTSGPSDALRELSIANAPKPETPEAPSETPSDTQSPYFPRYTGGESAAERYLANDVFKAPQSAEDIQREKLRSAQAEIKSLNDYGKTLLDEQRTINDTRMRETSATNVLSGLSGSSEANITTEKTRAQNTQDLTKIRQATEVQIQGILSEIRRSSVEEARQQREDARTGAQASIEMIEKQVSKAKEHVATLASSGATVAGFKKTDPKGYEYIAAKVGGEQALKALFTLNRPVDSIVDKRLEGGKYVVAYQNPLTGKISIETVDTGLPPNYTKTIDAGDRILAMPENWSGDPSELITIEKGLTPASQQSAAGDMYGGYNDDQNKVITRVDDKVSKNDTYKKTSNMRSYVDNVNTSLSLESGTGDLAAINQFQKVIDEGAVTRDQDVKLIQSSQSLLNRLRTFEKRLADGEQLSPDLRAEMRTAVNSMYKAQTDALKKDPFIKSKTAELQRYGVNPNDTIIGELGAFDAEGDNLRSRVDAAGFDYDAMKADGLSDEEISAAIQ